MIRNIFSPLTEEVLPVAKLGRRRYNKLDCVWRGFMESGEAFWWGALYAVPLWLMGFLYIIPMWRLGKASLKFYLFTSFEIFWVINYFGVWAVQDELHWRATFVEPVIKYGAAVGAVFFAVWGIYALMRRSKTCGEKGE